MTSKLLIGLGNIGDKYSATRHNYGFRVIDELIKEYNFSFVNNKFKGDLYKVIFANQIIYALKPNTYMNLSGISVIEVINFYKIEVSNIYVFYDDLDIEFGKVRIKKGGGEAGHNGIKSLNQYIKNEYFKIRLGIKNEMLNRNISDYVLENFTCEEDKVVENIINKITKMLNMILNNDHNNFLNKFYLNK